MNQIERQKLFEAERHVAEITKQLQIAQGARDRLLREVLDNEGADDRRKFVR
jgi:hypothetical protein